MGFIKQKSASFLDEMKKFGEPYEKKHPSEYVVPIIEGLCGAFNVVPWGATLLLYAALNLTLSLAKTVFYASASICFLLLHILPFLLNFSARAIYSLCATAAQLLQALKVFSGIIYVLGYGFGYTLFHLGMLISGGEPSRDAEDESIRLINGIKKHYADVCCIKYIIFPLFLIVNFFGCEPVKTASFINNLHILLKAAEEKCLTSFVELGHGLIFSAQVILGTALDEITQISQLFFSPFIIVRNEVIQRSFGFGSSMDIGIVINGNEDEGFAKKILQDNSKLSRITLVNCNEYTACIDQNSQNADVCVWGPSYMNELKEKRTVVAINDASWPDEAKADLLVRVTTKDINLTHQEGEKAGIEIKLLQNSKMGVVCTETETTFQQMQTCKFICENLLGYTMVHVDQADQRNTLIEADKVNAISKLPTVRL